MTQKKRGNSLFFLGLLTVYVRRLRYHSITALNVPSSPQLLLPSTTASFSCVCCCVCPIYKTWRNGSNRAGTTSGFLIALPPYTLRAIIYVIITIRSSDQRTQSAVANKKNGRKRAIRKPYEAVRVIPLHNNGCPTGFRRLQIVTANQTGREGRYFSVGNIDKFPFKFSSSCTRNRTGLRKQAENCSFYSRVTASNT